MAGDSSEVNNWWPLQGFLRWLADATGALTLAVSAWALVYQQPLPQAVLALFVCLVSSVALASAVLIQRDLARLRVTVGRQDRRVGALPNFATSVMHLSRAVNTVAGPGAGSPEQFVAQAQLSCVALAASFGTATGQTCRITVLETFIVEDAGGRALPVAVRPLCRSYEPLTVSTTTDWVEDNTDFDEIMVKGRSSFLCNDLAGELAHGYRNSHWAKADIEKWTKDGQFPYRSVLVWPIRERVDDVGGTSRWSILGFVCVDSTGPDAFDPNTDTVIGEAYAHALHAGLRLYRGTQEQGSATARGTG